MKTVLEKTIDLCLDGMNHFVDNTILNIENTLNELSEFDHSTKLLGEALNINTDALTEKIISINKMSGKLNKISSVVELLMTTLTKKEIAAVLASKLADQKDDSIESKLRKLKEMLGSDDD